MPNAILPLGPDDASFSGHALPALRNTGFMLLVLYLIHYLCYLDSPLDMLDRPHALPAVSEACVRCVANFTESLAHPIFRASKKSSAQNLTGRSARLSFNLGFRNTWMQFHNEPSAFL